MPIVNLYRKEASEVFPDLRFVTFKFAIGTEQSIVNTAGAGYFSFNFDAFKLAQSKLARELKTYLKELDISYAWPNGGSVNYSSLITVVLPNQHDYTLIKLMSDEYDIHTSHMLPTNLPSYMFHLTTSDYEKHKNAISEAKRKFSQQ